MKRIIFAVLLGVLVSGAAWGEGWVCIGDQSAGFSYNKRTDKWDQTFFATDAKYLIRRPNQKKQPPPGSELFVNPPRWEVVRFGKKYPLFRCGRGFEENAMSICGGLTGDFLFNPQTLRYLKTYKHGYVNHGTPDEPDEKSDTPLIEIGTCAPM